MPETTTSAATGATDAVAGTGPGSTECSEGSERAGGGHGRAAWSVIAGAVVVQALTAPGQTVGISVFVDPIMEDLALSRSAVAAAYLLGTLAGAAVLSTAGRLIDRHGVRRAVAVLSGAFGLVLVAMAGVNGFVPLALGFAGTRALGQGALTLAATTSIAVNFDRRRGWATGMKTAGGGALLSLMPLLFGVLIATVGWRASWLVLAVAVWVVLLGLAASPVLVQRPLPPGERVDRPQSGAGGWPPRAALATPAFWVVTSGVGLSALVSTGLIFHQISILGGQGFTATQAAANFLPQTLAGAAAALGAGSLADRVAPRIMMAGCLVLLAAAPVLAMHVVPGWSGLLYGVVLGGAAAAIRTVEATVLPRWFGVGHIGEIRGIVMTVAVAASAAGPLVLAAGAARFDGYGPPLQLFALAAIMAATAAARIRPPNPPGPPARTPPRPTPAGATTPTPR
jgi:MFS family permease